MASNTLARIRSDYDETYCINVIAMLDAAEPTHRKSYY
jgi:hypothetical protein